MNLKDVKVGDTLIRLSRHYTDSRISNRLLRRDRHYADSEVVKVDGVTDTEIIIGNGRFQKSDGRIIGGNFRSGFLAIPRKGEIEKIQEARLHHQLVYRIKNICCISRLHNMPLEKLQQLNALLGTTEVEP